MAVVGLELEPRITGSICFENGEPMICLELGCSTAHGFIFGCPLYRDEAVPNKLPPASYTCDRPHDSAYSSALDWLGAHRVAIGSRHVDYVPTQVGAGPICSGYPLKLEKFIKTHRTTNVH